MVSNHAHSSVERNSSNDAKEMEKEAASNKLQAISCKQ